MFKILVVDDISEIVEVLEQLLLKNNYEVITALGGKECLRILESGTKIDLIMLDLRMPGMDGTEVLEKVKKLRENLPVIILSGSPASERHVDRLRNIGYNIEDALYKPIDFEIILKKIKDKLK